MTSKEKTRKPPWKVQISLPKWAGERLLALQEELEIERMGQVSYGQIVGEALGWMQEKRRLEREENEKMLMEKKRQIAQAVAESSEPAHYKEIEEEVYNASTEALTDTQGDDDAPDGGDDEDDDSPF